MQKIYLLLRSNKQTGPYSLEELLQLNPKPFDLIWVEGRSAAWQYPFEVPALKPYVPETPQADVPFQPLPTEVLEQHFSEPEKTAGQKTEIPRKVFVSIPKTYKTPEPPAQRKEQAKPMASSYEQSYASYSEQKPAEENPVSTNYSRSLHEVEEEYTNWTYNQKTKKKTSVNTKDLVIAGLILAMIGGGYYVMSRPSVTTSILPAKKIEAQTIQQQETTEPNILEQVKQPDETVLQQEHMNITSNASQNETPVKNPELKNRVSVPRNQTAKTAPPVQNSMPVEKTVSNIPDDNMVVTSEPERKQQPKENASTEKKKKFGDVIKGIFSKKDKKEESPKNDEVVLQDPRPANNRQATRRDDNEQPANNNSGEVNTAALAEQVDLYSNAPDNWMMGVRDLKITLRNRSNITIQTAAVTVSYYDENNRLLEKKMIYFNNVAPKAKATIAAPDQKWADHVEYKLTTISAKEDRYASY
jgi:hypothetical protein